MQHAWKQCSLGACCEQAAAATPAAEPAVLGCGDSACVRMLKGKTPKLYLRFPADETRVDKRLHPLTGHSMSLQRMQGSLWR